MYIYIYMMCIIYIYDNIYIYDKYIIYIWYIIYNIYMWYIYIYVVYIYIWYIYIYMKYIYMKYIYMKYIYMIYIYDIYASIVQGQGQGEELSTLSTSSASVCKLSDTSQEPGWKFVSATELSTLSLAASEQNAMSASWTCHEHRLLGHLFSRVLAFTL